MVHCKYDELIEPKKLKNHPKNRNKHDQVQIERLALLYEKHGIRHPIIVSKESGFIVAGHGRKLAALYGGIAKFPVVYQEFESEEMEYQFLQADNAIALWAELDFEAIKVDLKQFDIHFDMNLLAIKNFIKEDHYKFNAEDEWTDMPEFDQEDKQSFRKIIVHFDNEKDVNKFFKTIKQKHSEETKSIWFPFKKKKVTKNKKYE